MTHIYLDNAATSFPKPEPVYAAVDDFNRRLGAAAGRGGYRAAVEVDAVLRRCRKQAADLLGAASSTDVAWSFNATDAINMALTLLEPGDHVVTTAAEHNSVIRPLRTSADLGHIELTVVDVDDCGRVDPTSIRSALRSDTRLIALQHASNVTGIVQPVADVGSIAHNHGCLLLVDAAQTAGHVPINVSDWPVDLLACAGHKGLLGPLGTGLLWVRPGLHTQVRGLRQGGTGSESERDRQPAAMPDKLEAGNWNVPGLFGLDAALTWLSEQSIETLAKVESQLTDRLLDGLEAIPGVRTVGPGAGSGRVGVVSLVCESLEPHVLATILDDSFAIQARAGLHCAPGIHRSIGTLNDGGTLRLSPGAFNSTDDIDAVCAALSGVLGG